MSRKLKSEFMKLLREDEEFRYAVAGLIGLEEILKRLDKHEEELIKLREETNKLRIETNKLRIETNKLREDFNKAFKQINLRLNRVERTLEKLTLDIEEEARAIIEHRLKELGIKIKIKQLILPEVEINIYGATKDICIIGETSVKASPKIINQLNKKITILKKKYPNKLKPKIIKVIYTSLALPNLKEKAEKENIWILKATENITTPKIQ